MSQVNVIVSPVLSLVITEWSSRFLQQIIASYLSAADFSWMHSTLYKFTYLLTHVAEISLVRHVG